MRSPVAALIGLAVSACASASVTAPEQIDIEQSRQVPIPFELAWTRAVDWFASSNITIEKIEKPSGLITAKYALVVSEDMLDCGQIKMTGVLGHPEIQRLGTLNVTIRQVGQSNSKVTANFFGEFRLVGEDAWDRRPVVLEGTCLTNYLRWFTSQEVRTHLDHLAYRVVSRRTFAILFATRGLRGD